MTPVPMRTNPPSAMLEKSAANADTTKTSAETRHAAALYGVYEISKLLTSPARLETTLSSVMALLASFLDMRHGMIALLNEAGDPETAVGANWNEAAAMEYFERLPERAIGQIVVTKMPLVVLDVAADSRFVSWQTVVPGRRTCFIGVPVMDRDKVIGTLTIDQDYAEDTIPPADESVRFLSMVANLLGQTVRLQRLIRSDRERLLADQRRLEKVLEQKTSKDQTKTVAGILGESESVQAVLHKIRIVAPSNSWVLLRGESGTGKELFAQAIHTLSSRKNKPFIKLNCAALPESVLESELFGHEKGAFTGAVALRKGRFELADGGTLFLDEIGEISPAFQAKLLRVLQEGEFERVGGSRTLKVNFRLISATNRNLEEAVSRGEFRADLYYRISIIPVLLPPLRDRPGDVAILAREFLARFNEENGCSLDLSEGSMNVLQACAFPGNIRELENCIRHTATLAEGPHISASDFACRHDSCLSSMVWRGDTAKHHGGAIQTPMPGAGSNLNAPLPDPHVPPANHDDAWTRSHRAPDHADAKPVESDDFHGGHEDRERSRLLDAMEKAGWVQAKAARLLGLTPRQIGYALIKHGIPIKKF
ncbi:MAG: nif-specific transcriptional activator NifA [Beijerinckiaceae bacterium]